MSTVVKVYLALLLVIPPILLVLDIEGVLALGLVMAVIYALLYVPLVLFAIMAARSRPRHS